MARPARGTLAELRPDIAAQLVDKSLGNKLSVGSEQTVEWECEHGHRWKAKVYNRTNSKRGTSCPICTGRQVLVGFNSLLDTDPDVAKLCANPEDAKTHTRSSNKKILWKCEYGHTWEAPVSRVANKRGACPICSGRVPEVGVNDLATTHPEIAVELENQSLATSLKAGTNKKVWWICPNNPNHRYQDSPYHRTHRNTGCPYCSHHRIIAEESSLAVTHPDLAAQLVHPEDAYKYSAGSSQMLEWRCPDHPDHVWQAIVWNRTHQNSGCPICNGKEVKESFNDLWTTRPDLAARLVDPEVGKTVTQASAKVVQWKCEKDPTHTWEASVYNEARASSTHCPICSHAHRSYKEQELEKFVRLLVGDDETIINSDRSVTGADRELDIYLPDKNLAIEFNGTYWHSDAHKEDTNYHLDKYLRCKNKCVRLIQIWEDDWDDKRELCLRLIAEALDSTENLVSIIPDINPKAAESLSVSDLVASEVTSVEAANFMVANSFSGYAPHKMAFALKDADGDIRALLAISPLVLSDPIEFVSSEYRINSFCTLGNVNDAFSTLLAFADKEISKKDSPVLSWSSLTSNDISNNSLFVDNGFISLGESEPAYKYVGDITSMKRVSKASIAPKLDINSDWTDYDIELANNLYRTYDSGFTKWIKILVK